MVTGHEKHAEEGAVGNRMTEMKYFLLETDNANHIPYSINPNGAIDIRNLNKENAYKTSSCCIVDMEIPSEVFFPDLIIKPMLMVTDQFAETIRMYAPETIFKTIYLLHRGSGVHRTYHMPFLEEMECLAPRTTRSRGGTALLQIVLHKETVVDKAVFVIAGFTHKYMIGRLDFVESILRRGIKGISITEVETI